MSLLALYWLQPCKSLQFGCCAAAEVKDSFLRRGIFCSESCLVHACRAVEAAAESASDMVKRASCLMLPCACVQGRRGCG